MNPIVRPILPLIVVAATTTAAVAQPAPPPDVAISAGDRALLEQGEYSAGEIIVSGAVGMFVGFGSGQAVQGRWGERGWIFTAGELGSIGLMIGGAMSCADPDGCNEDLATGLVIGGVVGFLAFRTWEVVDVWAAPFSHNRKVKAARRRAAGAMPYVKQTGDGGGVAGLSMTF